MKDVASFIAAGNEGMGRGTIGSPGVSTSAITVGASTFNAEALYLVGYRPFTNSNGMVQKKDHHEYNHMIFWSSRVSTAQRQTDPSKILLLWARVNRR